MRKILAAGAVLFLCASGANAQMTYDGNGNLILTPEEKAIQKPCLDAFDAVKDHKPGGPKVDLSKCQKWNDYLHTKYRQTHPAGDD